MKKSGAYDYIAIGCIEARLTILSNQQYEAF